MQTRIRNTKEHQTSKKISESPYKLDSTDALYFIPSMCLWYLAFYSIKGV